MTVSGEQQRDSAMQTHGSILPQNPLPARPPDVASFLISDLDCQAQLDVILPVRGVVGRDCPGNSEDRRVILRIIWDVFLPSKILIFILSGLRELG